MMMLGMGAGFDFNGYRDVFEQGTCDNGVRKLAALLGWEVSHCHYAAARALTSL